MIDIRKLRDDPEAMRAALAGKGAAAALDDILALDEQRRRVLAEAQALKTRRNRVSKTIGAAIKAGEDAREQQQAVRELGGRIRALDAEATEIEARLEDALLRIPNPPHATTPAGPDAAANREVRVHGEPRACTETDRPHWDLGEQLGWFDFPRAARMTGAGFPLLRGTGARLQRALIQFMLDLHVSEHGYQEVAPPCLCNRAAMTGTGQLPKMEDDMYRIESDDLFLIPTGEVPLTNLFREEIIEEPLPVKLTACTPCFRREAGAAGRDTRGLNRVHQFEKVELVQLVEPQRSYDALESLVGEAEAVLQRLELTYRIMALCSGDLSFAAAKCYDIEVWAPGQAAWLEVSSCSNFEDFQARRAGIRYRDAQGRAAYVHTLNGSGVALPRLLVALMEQHQQAENRVHVPEALRPYLGGARDLGG